MGAGLLAKAVYQSTHELTDRPHSRASPLPQLDLRQSSEAFEVTLFNRPALAQALAAQHHPVDQAEQALDAE
ncbi:hypothetical protein D0N73_19605 [Pseudomonas fluorescens]|nr:hypothetical protein D0N73_19605 [Pseudomonas fluorescens]